jgi:hypothetical protein
MAKKPTTPKKLDFIEIVMHAEAEVIKAAYEARLQIDELLARRAEAYRQIFELENQIEEIVGEPGIFSFPAPPCPLAGFSKAVSSTRTLPKPPAPKPPSQAANTPTAPKTASAPSAPADSADPEPENSAEKDIQTA